MRYALVLLLLAGCTREVVKVETIEVPTPPIHITDTVFVPSSFEGTYGGECDTMKILDLYCRGQGSGTTDGVDWRARYDHAKRLLAVAINKPADTIRVTRLDTVKTTVVQEYSFWEKTKLSGFWFLIGCVVGIVFFLAVRIGLIKFPGI